jgi:hypothetical protein
MDFECMHCRKMFTRKWFDLGKAFERVHYLSPLSLDEVEIEDADSIGVYCTQECLNSGRAALMNSEGVPIPTVRPGIGPVESCAKCSGPVDMSDWHLTYTEGCQMEERGGVRIVEVDYVAVVCRECVARTQSEEEAEPSLSQLRM